ncbi:YfhO family protein [Mesoflavibacter sp. SCSIO 43206]|uniref:YfhO family protein n=1 Tax=Mesoflavibacter sp. SCSIO 43206 TaxID=2779362 RepID=UPI001CA8D73F|nr:YfhO family protein [Mesoflavibacter sp. SCSIO 43206]UAB75240.1 YfhO family protein [Mesoflavibacter sp. SCSIO 43206]
MPFSFKKLLPHVIVLVGFIVCALLYFNPVLQGKTIFQSDIVHYQGMAKQQKDFKAETGKETYWTNSAFGGMPTYQLGAKYPNNYIKKLDLSLRFLPRPADYLFLYFLGFYILLLVLKVDWKLAGLGALAFGFSTYLIIILGVGHNSKAHAIAYMPLVLSGIILTFRKKYIAGFLLTAVAMGLELVANHYQMTYYLLLLVIILGIVYLIDAYKKQELPHYFKSIGILVLAVILSIGLNATNILATKEYVNESTRGKSELTINPDGTNRENTNGLSKEYITEYSYGIIESFNLFIPRFYGGGSGEDVGENSAMYKFFTDRGVSPVEAKEYAKSTPTYWGDQTIVEAPAYIGAVVIFLFVLGLFLVKGRLKWWLVGGTVLSLLLSYGKNLEFLTDFFINFVPLYNKFRAVSSIQVILELCIPILAIIAIKKLFDNTSDEEKLNALKKTTMITAGFAVLILLGKLFGVFDFVGGNDGYYRQNYGQEFVDALREDRASFLTMDTFRTLIFVLLSAEIIYLFLKKKVNETKVILAFAVLIVVDLVSVDRRYVNNDDFVSKIKMERPYQANKADLQILKDDSNYRVYDLTSGGAKASYFHNALGGYHAAKPNRYQDLYEFYLSKNNINVLNMLNAKYIIGQGENGEPFPYLNNDANGNAWFVKQLKKVNNADQEIKILDSLDNKNVAVFSITDLKAKTFKVDSTASIKVETYKPNYIKYSSNNSNEGFAVFSEMYYANGWNAYIDGNLKPHYKVNYALRGLQIPKGKHTVEFKFEPKVVKSGSQIALTSSVILFLLIIGGLFYLFKTNKPE